MRASERKDKKGVSGLSVEERHLVNLQIELSPEDRLGLEDFLFKIRRNCLLKFKRKPALGLQTICKVVLELMIQDKEFRNRIEELLMERINKKLQAK